MEDWGFGKCAATHGATEGSGRLFLMGSAILEVVVIWETKGWLSLQRDKVVMGVGKYGGRRRKAVINRSAREGIERRRWRARGTGWLICKFLETEGRRSTPLFGSGRL
jgi:hypothetical protein